MIASNKIFYPIIVVFSLLCLLTYLCFFHEKPIPQTLTNISDGYRLTSNSIFKVVYQNPDKETDESKINIQAPLKNNIVGDYGVLVGDFNSDKINDVIFMNHGFKPSILLNRDDGGFENIFASSGVKWGEWEYPQHSDRHGGSCADFDNDGDIDLLITHGAKKGETLGVKHAEFLLNDGNANFIEISERSGLLNKLGRARVGSWVDYNSDGYLDVYMSNYESNNVLYHNNGDGTFRDVSDSLHLENVGPRSIWTDINSDNFPDLLVSWPFRILTNFAGEKFGDQTNLFIRRNKLLPKPPYSIALGDIDGDDDIDLVLGGYVSAARIYWNIEGKFIPDDKELYKLEDGQHGAAVHIFDIDNDSDLDILTSSSENLLLHLNMNNQRFKTEEINFLETDGYGTAGGLATADLNNDGYLDFAVQTAKQNIIAINQFTGNYWIKLDLIGTKSNRQGIGAKLWITLEDGRILYRENRGHNGVYQSLSCSEPLIGVAQSKKVDIKIRWPSGITMKYYNVETNKSTLLIEQAIKN